ncbi:MAG: hypothetical protein K6A90_08905 [Lachnospiraceae bacterium]|nr:hypothetical protein [Lachnospiraceae bacterium]
MTNEGTESNSSRTARICLLILIPLIGIGGTALVSLVKVFSLKEIILNTAVSAILCIMAEIPIEEIKIDRNGVKYFVIAYLSGIIMAVTSGFLYEFIFPLAAPAVVIGMLTGPLMATASLVLFCGISTLVLYESGLYFLYIFVTGFILIMLFCRGKKVSRFMPMITYLATSAVIFVACFFLSEAVFSPEIVFFPAVGVFLNVLIVIIMVPKIYDEILDKTDNLWAKINDPEYDLLQTLKSTDKREYDRMVHTAHISGILCEKMQTDRRKTMGVCYYHRIGCLRGGQDNIEIKSLSLIRYRGFPDEIVEGIQELYGLKGRLLSRESALVLLTDRFIEYIYSYMDSHNGEKPDYDSTVEKIVKEALRDRKFLTSSLTFNDINIINSVLRNEKFYYDFIL